MDFKTIFLDYFQKCLNEGVDIEIAALRDIASENGTSANAALKELMQEGIVTSIPEVALDKINMPIDELRKFKLTEKGIDYINHRSEEHKRTSEFSYIDAYKKAWENATNDFSSEIDAFVASGLAKHFLQSIEQYKSLLNNIPWDTINHVKVLRDLQMHLPKFATSDDNIQSSFTPDQRQQITDIYTEISDIVKQRYNGKNSKVLISFLNQIDNDKSAFLGKDEKTNPEIKENKTTPEKNIKTFTFEGILGQNCGNVVVPAGEDEKRIKVRGFKVENGIRVMRGFAKSSDLAAISKADKNYQRDNNSEHLTALSSFMTNIKASAKYLPEVTLVARGYMKLDRITLSGQLSPTQQGELNNLEYFRLTVKKKQLYRIDGNHRLEALQDSDYYIPFAIIIWEESKVNQDDEAFLFYFLNAKAKRLTTEENLKGLLQATTWNENELKEANFYIPHLILLKELFEKNPLLNAQFCNNKFIKLIFELLKKIDVEITIEEFEKIIIIMGQLLIKDQWENLKQFDFYFQLVFYIAYKHNNIDESLSVLTLLESWVKKYKFDNTTFNDPILLYNNAVKTNNLNPINIFVAMPYDEENIDNFTEWINNAISKLNGKYTKYKDRLKLNPIMPKRGYAIDLIDNIMNEINKCDIFIADISPYTINCEGQEIKYDVNPNVMYEFGIAHNLKKPIILMREDIKIPNIPSDIQEKYRNTYKRSNTKKTQKTIQNAIKCVLDDFFE